MSSMLAVIQEKAQQLSPQKQERVIRFMDGLLQEEAAPFSRGLTFDWCAGPDDPPAEMSSVEMQHEVLEECFKKTLKQQPKMKLNWAGGLRHLRDQYTAVELQHEASKWIEESALAYLKKDESVK